ncbi:MAG: PIN domain-containing protein [bacterium]
MEITALGNLVLVDTSVWIDYFRKKDPSLSQVDNLMEEGRIGTCRLVIAELLQGARGSKEIEIILDIPDTITILYLNILF